MYFVFSPSLFLVKFFTISVFTLTLYSDLHIIKERTKKEMSNANEGIMSRTENIAYKIILMQLGISQRELSNILGYSEQYISMILAGKRKNKRFENWIKPKLHKLSKMEDLY